MFKSFTFLLLFAVNFTVWSQMITADSIWCLPIGTAKPELSAGFGDIRPNHFHMGLDFRTDGKEGIPLYAIADGYISRIRISSSGYGRVIYIDHPNGLTSVYAHCSQFSERINSFVIPTQIQFEQNELDWKFSPNELPVNKGEQIALSGNSGNSTGPHLHFELRDTKTEHALNPLLHGFHVSDVAPPSLHGIRLLAIDENGFVVPAKSLIIPLTKNVHRVKLPQDFIQGTDKLGITISATDPMKSGGHGFGLFSAEIVSSNHEQFGFEMADISFDDSRYVNNHMDYDEYKSKGIKYQKLFRNKYNPLTIYQLESRGGISLHGFDSISCSIILEDVNGNVSQHELLIEYPFEMKQMKHPFFDPLLYFLPEALYTFHSENMKVLVDPNTFYEPIKKTMNLSFGQFGNSKTVIQKPICVEMRAKNTPAIEKQYLAINGDALECTRENGWLASESKQLGTFSIKVDTVAPTIVFMPTSSNVVIPNQFSWKMTDGQSGIAKYELLINAEWNTVYFDQKNNLVTWKNDRRATIIGPPSENVLSMEFRVTDRCGNVQTWSKVVNVIDEPR
ncbi:MAG: M23 family metallopeptidase [Crocinitomicaceae bacterium]|nr:M23 family metallopeptidase [Crocinitomicaceae bacterium]MBP6032209.1 M23 family metallopeptidase [Crocinitomicaceae bacterium]